MKQPIRHTAARGLALTLAASLAIPAWGAPGDVMTSSPAPVIGADPPKARDIKDGDASVSTQTGALQYSYPITVPPGRNGIQPSLALTYSSQSHTYGGIASGWSLSVPEIRLDTSISPLTQLFYRAWEQEHFVSTLSGSRPLVVVSEPKGTTTYATFRAQNDSSYLRYERMNEGTSFLWRARSPDGTTYYFGDTGLSDGWSQELRVPLTRTVDSFGNTVEYQWAGTELQQIRYTSNPTAQLPAFARVEFDYQSDNCGTRLPPGAADDLRLGIVEGQRRLTKIRAVAFDPASSAVQHTREYSLGYDDQTANCYVLHGLTRQLTSIQESAWGPSAPRVDLPPVTFEYNRRARTFDQVTAENPAWPPEPHLVVNSSSSGTRSPGGWPAVHSMLLDFDADGLPDRIALSRAIANECAFTWQRNLGRDSDGRVQFGLPSAPQVMPRLPWENGVQTEPETCALNFQRTKIHNVNPGNVAGDCADHNLGSYLVYRWIDATGDGRIDLVAAIQHSHHLNPDGLPLNVELKLGSVVWPSCTPTPPPLLSLPGKCMQNAVKCVDGQGCGLDRGVVPTCMADGVATDPERISRSAESAGEEFRQWVLSHGPLLPEWPPGNPPPGEPPPDNQLRCDYVRPQIRCDRSPWFIYENRPDVAQTARLTDAGVVKYQLAQLESDNGDSSIGGASGWSSESHAIQDLDGDGNLDVAVRGTSTDKNAPNYWNVFPGDNQGGFLKDGAFPYLWFTPDDSAPSQGGGGCFGHFLGSCSGNQTDLDDYYTYASQLTADLNGDGAADFIRSESNEAEAQIFFGTGYGFRVWNRTQGDPLPGVRGSLSRSWAHTTLPEQSWLREGWRLSRTRLVDVDDDGRPDLIQSWPTSPWLAQWSPLRLHINAGGDFLAGVDLATQPALDRALTQQTTALSSGFYDFWATQRDLIDMDGDGLPEHWDFTKRDITSYRDESDQPLRLLRKIDNGIGGTVEIQYASTTNGKVVKQDPSTGKATPRPQWVVREMTVKDAWDPDISTTSYKYRNPVWNKDERGDYGFRGFEEVETRKPSGARGIDTYGFDVDWSGRLKASRTFSIEDTAGPRSITETTWKAYTLFGGALTTYHATDERSWTCRNGQNEAQCRAENARHTATTWKPLSSSSIFDPTPLMLVTSQRDLIAGETFGVGDRRSSTDHYLVADDKTYRLQEVSEASYESTADGLRLAARSERTFDPDYRAATSERRWFTDDTAQLANQPVTQWDLDWSTGVVLGTQSPRNWPSGPWERYQHDPTRRFVTRSTNELGHVVDRTYDPGTGATLSERGPTTAACGAGCNAPTTWTDVDGLGRALATYVAIPGVGTAWARTQISRTTYIDRIVNGARTGVIGESLIAYGEGRWTREETRIDGQGRPAETRVKTGLAADAVTTYDYDGRGDLLSVTLPDPSSTSTASPAPTVRYTYGYDSLGRPRWMRRPAMTGEPSGVEMTYDGRTRETLEIPGGEGGPTARKVLVHDLFDRLVEVREYTDLTAGTFATTRYAYDARDAVRRIENPDGVVTELVHDLLGRRTKIVRAGRTWTYGYDAAGNLTSESAPPPTAAQAAAYTTTFAYDELNRLRSRSVGQRDLSTADATALAVGTIQFGHDGCTNGVGQLCTVTFPGDALGISYQYDAEGNPATETRAFRFGDVADTRTTSTSYGPGGKVVQESFADGASGNFQPTRSRIAYDDRAQPVDLWWIAPGDGQQLVARQTRNVAGLVTRREARGANPNTTLFDTQFTYDRLSRVRSQVVRRLPSTQLAKQELDYFGQDDPSELRHWLQQDYYRLTFGYDARHQLTSASDAAGRYEARYGFLASGKLDSVTVKATPGPGSTVVPRDVKYEYQSPIDPEAVSALVPRSPSTVSRAYKYDTAGNMKTRAGGPAANEDFVYDGEDQLRRATVDGKREEYFYDHAGNRTAVVTRDSNGAVQTVRLFIGGSELVYAGNGQLTKTYAHLSLGTPVARIADRMKAEYQYHGLSSNTLLSVTPTGTVKSAFVYGPYGDVLYATGSDLTEQHRRFNDKFRDDLTSLSYYGVRYYDDVLLGWTQADPKYRIAPDAAWHEPRRALLYSMSGLNPLRYFDPDGRDWDWLDTAAFALGPGTVWTLADQVRDLQKDDVSLGEYLLDNMPGRAGDVADGAQAVYHASQGNWYTAAIYGAGIVVSEAVEQGMRERKADIKKAVNTLTTPKAPQIKLDRGDLEGALYRDGNANPGALTDKKNVGLSTRDSLSNPVTAKDNPMFGGIFQVLHPSRLPATARVAHDGVPGSLTTPPGHVSIYGATGKEVQDSIIRKNLKGVIPE